MSRWVFGGVRRAAFQEAEDSRSENELESGTQSDNINQCIELPQTPITYGALEQDISRWLDVLSELAGQDVCSMGEAQIRADIIQHWLVQARSDSSFARPTRVYLSHLPDDMEQAEFKELTGEFGTVLKHALHRESAYKVGWVEYATSVEGERAIKALDDRRVDEWSMRLQAYMYPGGCSFSTAEALPASQLPAMILRAGLRGRRLRPELGAALGGASAAAMRDNVEGWEDLVDIARFENLLLPIFLTGMQRLLALSPAEFVEQIRAMQNRN